MNYPILVFSRNDLKVILIGTLAGAVLQVICIKYIKNHPEFLDGQNSPTSEPEIKSPKRGLRRFSARGGAVLEIVGAQVLINIAAVVNFVAQKGSIAGLLGASAFVGFKKMPSTAISKFVKDALPYSHSDLGKSESKQFIRIQKNTVTLDYCSDSFLFLANILNSPSIPEYKKDRQTYSALTEHLDLKTMNKRVHFVLCIVNLLQMLSIQSDSANYYLMIGNLIQAIKEGKISKQVARLILRLLKERKIIISPEFINLIDSSLNPDN